MGSATPESKVNQKGSGTWKNPPVPRLVGSDPAVDAGSPPG